MSQFREITTENFESEVLGSSVPVLIDLYADWCSPCRMMGQLLERLAPQIQGRARIVKINTDDQPELAQAFGVSSIPMLVLIHNGKAVDGSVGLVPAAQILRMIDKVAPPVAASA